MLSRLLMAWRRCLAEEKVQMTFRVTTDFHKRIHTEAACREKSVQQMIQEALEMYFKTPSSQWDYAVTSFVTWGENASPKEADERQAWTELWIKCLNRLPHSITSVLADAMKWCLQTQKSSRRKL